MTTLQFPQSTRGPAPKLVLDNLFPPTSSRGQKPPHNSNLDALDLDKPFSKNEQRETIGPQKTDESPPITQRKSSLNMPAKLKRAKYIAGDSDMKEKRPSLALPERNSMMKMISPMRANNRSVQPAAKKVSKHVDDSDEENGEQQSHRYPSTHNSSKLRAQITMNERLPTPTKSEIEAFFAVSSDSYASPSAVRARQLKKIDDERVDLTTDQVNAKKKEESDEQHNKKTDNFAESVYGQLRRQKNMLKQAQEHEHEQPEQGHVIKIMSQMQNVLKLEDKFFRAYQDQTRQNRQRKRYQSKVSLKQLANKIDENEVDPQKNIQLNLRQEKMKVAKSKEEAISTTQKTFDFLVKQSRRQIPSIQPDVISKINNTFKACKQQYVPEEWKRERVSSNRAAYRQTQEDLNNSVLASPHYTDARQNVEFLLKRAQVEHEQYQRMSKGEKDQISTKFNARRKNHKMNQKNNCLMSILKSHDKSSVSIDSGFAISPLNSNQQSLHSENFPGFARTQQNFAPAANRLEDRFISNPDLRKTGDFGKQPPNQQTSTIQLMNSAAPFQIEFDMRKIQSPIMILNHVNSMGSVESPSAVSKTELISLSPSKHLKQTSISNIQNRDRLTQLNTSRGDIVSRRVEKEQFKLFLEDPNFVEKSAEFELDDHKVSKEVLSKIMSKATIENEKRDEWKEKKKKQVEEMGNLTTLLKKDVPSFQVKRTSEAAPTTLESISQASPRMNFMYASAGASVQPKNYPSTDTVQFLAHSYSLESLPESVAQFLKSIGCDDDFLHHNKQKGTSKKSTVLDRIQILDFLQLVHGGDPTQIPFPIGTKERHQEDSTKVTKQDRYCGQLASDREFTRILDLLDGAYGFTELPVKTRFQVLYEQHLKKMCRLLSDGEGGATTTAAAIPPHEHIIEICKRIGCQYWEREIADKIYAKSRKGASFMEEYQIFVVRTLNYHAFKDGDPIRERFRQFMRSQDSSKGDSEQDTFTHRQKIDQIIHVGKLQQRQIDAGDVMHSKLAVTDAHGNAITAVDHGTADSGAGSTFHLALQKSFSSKLMLEQQHSQTEEEDKVSGDKGASSNFTFAQFKSPQSLERKESQVVIECTESRLQILANVRSRPSGEITPLELKVILKSQDRDLFILKGKVLMPAKKLINEIEADLDLDAPCEDDEEQPKGMTTPSRVRVEKLDDDSASSYDDDDINSREEFEKKEKKMKQRRLQTHKTQSPSSSKQFFRDATAGKSLRILKKDLRPVEERSENTEHESIEKENWQRSNENLNFRLETGHSSLSQDTESAESWHLSQDDQARASFKIRGQSGMEFAKSFATTQRKAENGPMLLQDVVLNINTLREGRISDMMKIFTLNETQSTRLDRLINLEEYKKETDLDLSIRDRITQINVQRKEWRHEKDAELALIAELKATNPKAFIIWETERKKRKTVLDHKQETLMKSTVELAELVNTRYNYHCGNLEGKRPETTDSVEVSSPFGRVARSSDPEANTSDATSQRSSGVSSIMHSVLKGKLTKDNKFNTRKSNKAAVQRRGSVNWESFASPDRLRATIKKNKESEEASLRETRQEAVQQKQTQSRKKLKEAKEALLKKQQEDAELTSKAISDKERIESVLAQKQLEKVLDVGTKVETKLRQFEVDRSHKKRCGMNVQIKQQVKIPAEPTPSKQAKTKFLVVDTKKKFKPLGMLLQDLKGKHGLELVERHQSLVCKR